MSTLSLRPASLKRYKDLLVLFYKYGHGDLIKSAPLIDDPLPHAPPAPPSAVAEDLVKDIERLGPTYIKLGQLLSTRSDMVPEAYRAAFAKLQDHTEPVPIDNISALVSVEIGARLTKAFAEFDPEPFASASLGQVHRAVLRNGRRVVVKVQRPDARETVADDLAAMAELAEFLDQKTEAGKRYHFAGIVEELRKALLQELDYRLELNNLLQMRDALAEFPRILVPEPIADYSSGRVLTMEYVSGMKITSFSPMVQLDIDGEALAEEVFRAYLKQILVDGFFHADPHPGNVFLTEDHRIALLDLGMVGRIGSTMQEQLLKLLLAVADGEGDRAAAVATKMGEPLENFDAIQFRRRIAELVMQAHSKRLNDLQIGRLVLDIQHIAADCRLRVPSELSLLGKTLLNLDLVGKTLSPGFDPNASIRHNSARLLHARALHSLAPSNWLPTLLDAKETLEQLPSRLNQFTSLLANNNFRVKVDTIDENLFITTLQKVANRITIGLILAAMIMGASLLMRVETTFKIAGYPGLAMILFVAAFLGAAGLVAQILWKDLSQK